MSKKDKKLQYIAEAAGLYFIAFIARLLPLSMVRRLCAFLLMSLGPKTSAHKTALKNLAIVFPDQTAQQHQDTARKIWRNLGWNMAEMLVLDRLAAKWDQFVSFENDESLQQSRDQGKGVLFLSGHFGNWEIVAIAPAKAGFAPGFIYRPPNNPWVDRWLRKARLPIGGDLFHKGADSARHMIRYFQKGRPFALLIDQKLSNGAPLPFFGKPAYTSTQAVNLALKHDYDIFFLSCVRHVTGANHKFTISFEKIPTDKLSKNIDKQEAATHITLMLHKKLEALITAHPEQWFFVHDRWAINRRKHKRKPQDQ